MCFPSAGDAVGKDGNIKAIEEMFDRRRNCCGSGRKGYSLSNRTLTFIIENDLLSGSLIVDTAKLEGVHLMLILEARDADQIGLGGGVVVVAVGRRYDAVPSKLRSLLRADARNDSDSTHCCERFKWSYSTSQSSIGIYDIPESASGWIRQIFGPGAPELQTESPRQRDLESV